MWPSEGLGVDGNGRKWHCLPEGLLLHSHLSWSRRRSHSCPDMWSTFISPRYWDVASEALSTVLVECACRSVPGHPSVESLPALCGLPAVPHFISPGHMGSPFTAVGTLHTNAADCPGADYSRYIVVIIKLIIFLMLQICHFIFCEVFCVWVCARARGLYTFLTVFYIFKFWGEFLTLENMTFAFKI